MTRKRLEHVAATCASLLISLGAGLGVGAAMNADDPDGSSPTSTHDG